MKKYSNSKDVNLVYLEHPDNNHFFEVSEANNALRIRRGEVGKPCLVFNATYTTANKGRDIFESRIKHWKKQGFVATQASNAIIEGSIADELFAAEIEDHPVYSKFFDLGWASELRGKQERIFHFRNDLKYEGHLDLEDTADMDLAVGLIIEGDVHISSVFSQMTYIYPSPILITGSVNAQSLAHKDSHMFIEGNVHVENVVYGEYNDGQLEIGGDVHGKAWISSDHAMEAYGNYHLPRFYWGDEDSKWLSPKIFDLEGNLDEEVLREYIWAGKSPLRKGFVFTVPKTEESQTGPEKSELAQKMQALVLAEDTNGIVELLENWPEHDEEWELMVDLRLEAPTTTAEQLERLTKLKNDFLENERIEENTKTNFEDEVFNKVFELLKVLPDERDEGLEQILEMLNAPLNSPNTTPEQLEFLTKLKMEIEKQAALLGIYSDDHNILAESNKDDDSNVSDTSDKNLVRSTFDTINKSTRMRKSLKKAKQLNKTASKQQEVDSSKALVLYEQVIELSLEFVEGSYDGDFYDDINYNYLFALQGKLWCLNDLIEKGKLEHQVEVESFARNLLEYINDHQTWFYYSEEGQLSRSAELLAHNTLAWYGLKKGRDLIEKGEVATAVLEEALEHINTSIEKLDYSSEEEAYSVVLENKVEILLALGQSYEAYALVYQVQRRFPNLLYFKKIAKTPAYQQWDEEN